MNDQTQTFDQAIDQITHLLDHSDIFYGHGAPESKSEALWIIAYCAGISPIQVLDLLDENYDANHFSEAINITHERIQTRTPLAYILKEAWLMGYAFECDERSIVPRSLIAELITQGDLDDYLPPNGRVLDLCTGNGTLAILLSLHYPDIEICASDIDPAALELARQNLSNYELDEVIELIESDLFQELVEPNEENQFDLIICNPPYVNQTSMHQLPAEYLKEPSIALDGGTDGMQIIRKILNDVKNYLSNRGVLILEIGNEYENFIKVFPDLIVHWLEVSAGSQQVMLIHQADLP